jgi:hypothetical protein
MIRQVVFCLVLVSYVHISAVKITDETQAQSFLDEYDEYYRTVSTQSSLLAWAYYTNLTAHNSEASVSLSY